MKPSPKTFIVLLLLTITSITWAACSEGAVDDSKADCVAPLANGSIGPVVDMVDERVLGPAPDAYALKVQVETTALWASVEVTGVKSVTSKYAITRGDGEINVHVEEMEVYDLSRPEGGTNQNQEVVLEIDAIVQKRLTRPYSGYGRSALERPSTSCSPETAIPPRRLPDSPITRPITGVT